MAAIYSNGGNRWNILGFNFNKRDALSSVYKISMEGTGGRGQIEPGPPVTQPQPGSFLKQEGRAWERGW